MIYKRIAIDPSKAVFTVHGIDEHDRPVLRRDFRRAAFELFFAKLEPTDVVLEACGGSHHWARVPSAQGHRVRLIPPQNVKPFVKRGKSDQADAQALCEAAGRPEMATVPIKSAERQAGAMIISTRDMVVRQRTRIVNAIRGHATAFGVIAAKGLDLVEGLMARVMDPPEVPAEAQRHLMRLARRAAHLNARARADPVARRLMKVPSIGPITAMTLSLTVDASQFESRRHFSAWLGLTPRQHATGGKQRLGGISRAGNERCRRLLVVGAMMARGEDYRPRPVRL